ncbi:MAG: metallopeptidase family protein [Candidatus Pacebacteria bacterium]|nr:metallopeptidase family protein [Candidatus Paceibacterota bacterium]NUQ57391.1 metallopeptidase family protein [Candidatus Paceibacter sp.]
MLKKDFAKLVKEGIKAIPEKFLRLVNNAAIVVENWPSAEQKKKLRLRKNMTLLGLYEGVPRTKRDSGYNGILPDKITIFMGPILETAKDENDVKKIVRDTVWHEIAHHFGLSESEVKEAEKRKKKKN